MRRVATNPMVTTAPEPMERSRSHSETQQYKDVKRQGLPAKRDELSALLEASKSSVRHSRGFSHDSFDPSDRTRALKADTYLSRDTQSPRAYFTRFSRQSDAIKAHLASDKVFQLAHDLLFAFWRVHSSCLDYLSVCPANPFLSMIERLLFNTDVYMTGLVVVLEKRETEENSVATVEILHASVSCLCIFRQLTETLQKHTSEIVETTDLKFVRASLMSFYGISFELQNIWNLLKPNMMAGHQTGSSRFNHRLKSSSASSNTSNTGGSNASSNSTSFAMPPPPLPYKSDMSTPQTPMSSQSFNIGELQPADADDVLFDKVSSATNVSLSVLAILTDAVAKSVLQNSQKDIAAESLDNAVPSKLKELATMSLSAADVARQLKAHLHIVRDADINQRKKFWEDTQAFVKVVISVLALAKTVSIEANEYRFSENVLSGLSTLTRSTKELTILLSVSSFGSMGDSSLLSTSAMGSTPSLPATPLSAALGPAAQAVVSSPGGQNVTGGNSSTQHQSPL